MKTRSQTIEELDETVTNKTIIHQPTFEVNIDFDEASNAWLNNKKSIGNGQFKYICTKLIKTGPNKGTKCGKTSDYENNDYELCKIHYRQKYRTLDA